MAALIAGSSQGQDAMLPLQSLDSDLEQERCRLALPCAWPATFLRASSAC